MKTVVQKDTWTPMFTVALFTIAKIWKQPKCPSTYEWIKKMCYTYTMEYYLATKKEILPFATMRIDLEGIMLSEISQTEKDKYSVITYMWNLKNKTNNEYNKTETDSQI